MKNRPRGSPGREGSGLARSRMGAYPAALIRTVTARRRRPVEEVRAARAGSLYPESRGGPGGETNAPGVDVSGRALQKQAQPGAATIGDDELPGLILRVTAACEDQRDRVAVRARLAGTRGHTRQAGRGEHDGRSPLAAAGSHEDS